MTEKQQLFIAEYLINGFNATQAAIKAGYSEDSARAIGCENLTKPDIKKEIQKSINESISQKQDVLKKQILDELGGLAFQNDEIKHNDKIKSLELLGKYMSMWNEKQESNVTNIIYLDKAADVKGF